MEKLIIILEKSETGYGVYVPQIPGCFSYGDTIEEAKVNSADAIDSYLEAAKEFNQPLPSILKLPYKTVYRVDLRNFFKQFAIVNTAVLARQIKMNPSLIRQYRTGKKYPTIEQTKRIQGGLHKVATDLLSVHF